MNRFTKALMLLLCFPMLALAQEEQTEEHHATATDAAYTFYKKGESLHKSMQYDKAVLEYDYALAISDTLPMVHYAKGLSLLALKKNEKAIESFEKAIGLRSGFTNAYAALVKAYQNLNNEDEVIKTLTRLAEVETDPATKGETQIRIVKLYLKRKDFTSAHPFAKDAFENDRTNLDALYYNAVVNNGLGNFENAKETLEAVVPTLPEHNPKETAKFFYELGYAYHNLQEFEKSKEVFEKANFGPFRALIVKLTPEYFKNLGDCYTMVYEMQLAEEMLQEALKVDQNFAAAYEQLAAISEKKSTPLKAIEFYKKAVASVENKSKESVGLYEKLVDALINAGKYDEAVTYADECLSQAYNARPIQFMKAVAMFKAGKTPEASVEFEKLLKDANLTPIEAVKYNLAAGLVYKEMKAYQKAKDVLQFAQRGPFAHAVAHQLTLIEDAELALKYSN